MFVIPSPPTVSLSSRGLRPRGICSFFARRGCGYPILSPALGDKVGFGAIQAFRFCFELESRHSITFLVTITSAATGQRLIQRRSRPTLEWRKCGAHAD